MNVIRTYQKHFLFKKALETFSGYLVRVFADFDANVLTMDFLREETQSLNRANDSSLFLDTAKMKG